MAHVSQCEFRFNADLQAKYMGFLQGAVDPPFFIEEIIADNPPLTSSCSAYSFDAYMAITLVACSIENKDFLTNRDLLDAIRTLDFKGVTGTVRFDPVTGSRVASAQYAVSNIIRKSETESKIFFSVKVSTLVDIAVGGFQDKITVISPFVYADGTTNLPPSLPALTEKQQQFLFYPLQDVGVELIDEVIKGFPRSCGVIYPFLILMGLNIVLLTVWSVVDPLVWTLIELDTGLDSFGRATEVVVKCSSGNETNEIIFDAFFFLINFAAVVVANYQAYLGRNVKTDFNESVHVNSSSGRGSCARSASPGACANESVAAQSRRSSSSQFLRNSSTRRSSVSRSRRKSSTGSLRPAANNSEATSPQAGQVNSASDVASVQPSTP